MAQRWWCGGGAHIGATEDSVPRSRGDGPRAMRSAAAELKDMSDTHGVRWAQGRHMDTATRTCVHAQQAEAHRDSHSSQQG